MCLWAPSSYRYHRHFMHTRMNVSLPRGTKEKKEVFVFVVFLVHVHKPIRCCLFSSQITAAQTRQNESDADPIADGQREGRTNPHAVFPDHESHRSVLASTFQGQVLSSFRSNEEVAAWTEVQSLLRGQVGTVTHSLYEQPRILLYSEVDWKESGVDSRIASMLSRPGGYRPTVRKCRFCF